MTDTRALREAEGRVIDILRRAVAKVGNELGEEWKPDASILEGYVTSEGIRRGRAILEEAIQHLSNKDIEVAQKFLQEVQSGKRELEGR